MDFSERLIGTMKSKGVTAYRLAKDLGISEGTVRNWKRGNNRPDAVHVVDLANYLSVSPGWLMYGEGTKGSVELINIPVIESGLDWDTYRVSDGTEGKTISIPNMPVGARAVCVRDEAMSPTLKSGDYVVLVEAEKIKNGDIVVYSDEYDALHLRRHRILHGNKLLVSDNKDYEPIEYSRVKRIFGKAITVWREVGF
jgi:SOS-response transcriptional repressor LexA